MAVLLNILEGIVAGEYGKPIELTMKDGDGVVQDISTFDTFLVNLRSPDGSKIFQKQAALVTNGTDGKITFQFANAQSIIMPGDWDGTVLLEDLDSDQNIIELSKSYQFIMRVQPAVPTS